ncbi:DHA2 family efflux MFS transporter permease subunit [Glycomyces sp. NPDC047369]
MTSQTTQPDRLDPALIRLGLALVLGVFMSMLDTTIVNVALETLGREFDTGLATMQWVVTGYLLALAVVIPTTGWLSDRFGAKRVFLFANALFGSASLLCALAWSPGSLIAFRLVQGAAGALLMPVAQSILARAAGPKRMGRVMALVGLPALLAPILGPVIGGIIVDHVSWWWIFLINVPVAVVSVLLCARVLPADPPERRAGTFDVVGLCLLGPGLAALIYGLSEAGKAGSFTATGALTALAAGAIGLAAFMSYAARRGDRALVPLAYFKDRAFAGSSVVSVVQGAAVFGVMLLLPLCYQQVRGETALTAGLLLAPQGLGTALSMPIAGKLADRIGPRKVVMAGGLLILTSTAVLTQVDATTSYWLLALALTVRGLGFGATMMPAMAAGYRNLPPEAVGHASSVLQILSRTGGTIGAALMAVVLTWNLSGATDPGAAASAFADTFWWATAATALIVVFAPLLPATPVPDTRTPGGSS